MKNIIINTSEEATFDLLFMNAKKLGTESVRKLFLRSLQGAKDSIEAASMDIIAYDEEEDGSTFTERELECFIKDVTEARDWISTILHTARRVRQIIEEESVRERRLLEAGAQEEGGERK